MPHITPVVLKLILLNIFIYIGLHFLPPYINEEFFILHKSNFFGLHETMIKGFENYYVLNVGETKIPIDSADSFQWIQIVTSFFNHGSIMHILFNLWGLISFCPLIEIVIGEKRFLQTYLFCGVLGTLFCAFLDPSPNPVLGASGAISGLMVIFALYFPNNKLSIMIPFPITLEAKNWAILFGTISAFFVISDYFHLVYASWAGNISHFGHLAGMVAALIYYYGNGFLRKIM
jgi:membrane associated rhomboid family serine protease